ncbi:MAG: beta-galactosidase [Capsulimonadaceae bacterium]|nr:beta-galactosidase [Capsulimonadaceae bacterium]
MKRIRKALLPLAAASALFAVQGAYAADQPLSLDGARLLDATATPSAAGLKVTFGANNAWPHILWSAPDSAGWDWSSHASLVLTLSNPAANDVAFCIRIDDDVTADGSKHCTAASATVSAGQTETFCFPLAAGDKPEDIGMRYAPPVIGATAGTPLTGNSSVDPRHIVAFQIFRARPDLPATLLVKSISLAGQRTELDLTRIVDQYGQYTHADWPGKVHSDADLATQQKAEQADWKAHPAPAGRDKWGGWATGPQRTATGFFRTEQLNGKWWLVDPDGHLFLSVGIDCVGSGAGTVIEGRESMFSWLPAPDDPLAVYYGRATSGMIPGRLYYGKTFNILGANLARKYGADKDAAFSDAAVSRLTSWGFNTIGNWSIEKIGRQHAFPYVATIGAWGQFARVPSGEDYWGKMPDPFDPGFAAAVDGSARSKASTVKDDPACLGYFCDNELSWGGGKSDIQHYGLSYGALSLGPEAPAKAAFLALLKSRYASIDQLNAAWGTSIASWDELSAPYKAPSPITTDAQRKDFSDFLSAYAEKYFDVVATAIKRYDPNHLYLGCRFAWFSEEAIRAAAKYADVISFNIYGWDRSKYLFAESYGKPCLVGEFHFGALDRGMFSGGLVLVKNQQDRGAHYSAYVTDVLSEPAFVGCHWFQYTDEPTTGRTGDGENYNIGFVSITDTPYSELIASARATNAKIYAIHGAAGATNGK